MASPALPVLALGTRHSPRHGISSAGSPDSGVRWHSPRLRLSAPPLGTASHLLTASPLPTPPAATREFLVPAVVRIRAFVDPDIQTVALTRRNILARWEASTHAGPKRPCDPSHVTPADLGSPVAVHTVAPCVTRPRVSLQGPLPVRLLREQPQPDDRPRDARQPRRGVGVGQPRGGLLGVQPAQGRQDARGDWVEAPAGKCCLPVQPRACSAGIAICAWLSARGCGQVPCYKEGRVTKTSFARH